MESPRFAGSKPDVRSPALTLICAAAAMMGLASPVGAQCPASLLGTGCSYHDWLGFESYLPGAQLLDGDPWSAGDPCEWGCYDIREGVLVAHGWANPWNGECGCAAFFRDEFQVVGVTAGTPLEFYAELWIEGSIEIQGSIRAGIGENSFWTDGLDIEDEGPVSTKLKYPLAYAAEQPFVLVAELLVVGRGIEGRAHASAVMRFSGLPPGASVISCQSYNLPVQVQQQTWGRVKSIYR